MLLLVTIDLARADLALFERYEVDVLDLLPKYNGRLEMRVRALNGQSETHLLFFPDEAAFESFRSDPKRLALSADWERCGARSVVQPVERFPHS
jgi:hypothetical protein